MLTCTSTLSVVADSAHRALSSGTDPHARQRELVRASLFMCPDRAAPVRRAA